MLQHVILAQFLILSFIGEVKQTIKNFKKSLETKVVKIALTQFRKDFEFGFNRVESHKRV